MIALPFMLGTAQAQDLAVLTNDTFGREFAVTIEGPGEFAGALIIQPYAGMVEQHWILGDLGDGSAELYSEAFGDSVCMTAIAEEQMINGFVIAMTDCEEDEPTQRWWLGDSGPDAATLESRAYPGMCLTAFNSPEWQPYLTLEACAGSSDQTWIATLLN